MYLDSFLIYDRMLLSRPGIGTDLTQVSLAPFPSKAIISVKGFRQYYPSYSMQTCAKKTKNKDDAQILHFSHHQLCPHTHTQLPPQ